MTDKEKIIQLIEAGNHELVKELIIGSVNESKTYSSILFEFTFNGLAALFFEPLDKENDNDIHPFYKSRNGKYLINYFADFTDDPYKSRIVIKLYEKLDNGERLGAPIRFVYWHNDIEMKEFIPTVLELTEYCL